MAYEKKIENILKSWRTDLCSLESFYQLVTKNWNWRIRIDFYGWTQGRWEWEQKGSGERRMRERVLEKQMECSWGRLYDKLET